MRLDFTMGDNNDGISSIIVVVTANIGNNNCICSIIVLVSVNIDNNGGNSSKTVPVLVTF